MNYKYKTFEEWKNEYSALFALSFNQYEILEKAWNASRELEHELNIPRQYSIVKLIPYPGVNNISSLCDPIIFLGEIPNMPGHCVVYSNKQITIGWHTDNFKEIPENET